MNLRGRTVVVTRSRQQARPLIEMLEEFGAQVVEFPLIRTVSAREMSPAERAPLEAAIRELAGGGQGASAYHWLILTSANGVDSFMERLQALGFDTGALAGVKVAAVGKATARALGEWGVEVALVPAEFRGEAVLAALAPQVGPGVRVLLARSDLAAPELPRGLAGLGVEVVDVVAYRTEPDGNGAGVVRAGLVAGRVDAITFTSPSTVRSCLQVLGQDAHQLLLPVVVACIGPVTARAAREQGLSVQVVASESTVEGLARSLAERLGPVANN